MKRLAATLALLVLALAAPAAQAEPFGLHGFEVAFTEADGSPDTQAGSHPFEMKTSFFANTLEAEGRELPVEPIKDVLISQIEGFVGNPSAVPTCSTRDFLEAGGGHVGCPAASAVGKIDVYLKSLETPEVEPIEGAVYWLDPAPGTVAKIGFYVGVVPVVADIGVSELPPYRAIGASRNISQILSFYGAELTLWGTPADKRHDAQRGDCLLLGGSCPGGSSEVPFLTLPRACGRPLRTDWATDPWPHPGAFATGSSPSPEIVGCDRLSFGPEISASPSTRAAQSPSGLDFALGVRDEGLASPNEGALAGADIERAIVALPVGMTVNPSQAEGLAVCTEAQLARESSDSGPGEGCPEAAKIGTIEVETPLLEGKLLNGSLYVAEPYHNLAGDSLIAVYVVIKNAELGIKVIQPIKVTPDPSTGQLVSSAEGMPQLPFSHFRLHFREGGRAPLISPPGCGSFDTTATLYPYSGGAPVTSTSAFQIISGPDDSPCPSGAPFDPGFEAGTRNNQAGSYSPFEMRLTRQDGEQDMGRFSFTLPPGVVPKLAGIPYCSDAQIAQARGRQGEHGGQEEIDAPSCPAQSQIGTTLGGAGVGSQLTYVPGKLYLAGPYNGDPISAVAIVPAVAGPFDAGTIVVREALRLNPVTHVGEVDGSASDPIPHILKGIPLNVREVRVSAERPEFTLNPTSCEPFAASSTIWGDGTALEPLPEHPVDLSSRFQAAGCASLGFKPKLGLKLRGGTKRGRFPALHALYTPRSHGDANLSRLALTFPHSEFIEQGHFRTICTRVQFAAGAGFGSECPKGSIYGQIKVWTPLLDEPLSGPVYLRSSNHNLPDAVFALHGLVDIELATRIDSTHGRLRAIVAELPRRPGLPGGGGHARADRRACSSTARNLCVKAKRTSARVNAGAQNGRREVTKPVMRATKCAKAHRGRHRAHHERHRGRGPAKRSTAR